MVQRFLQAMALFSRGTGVVLIYLGLVLTAAHYFAWGLASVLLGLAAFGMNEEGQD